jgi:predicted RNA polymerase sigma factor
MLGRFGRREAAKAAYVRAVRVAATEADRRFLTQRIDALAEDGALTD